MPDDVDTLLRRMIGGDHDAAAEIIDRAATDDTPVLLVAAALLSDRPAELLARGAEHATTTRDRQLVALATAHVDGDADRLDVLVRDHLADHPDNLLAAWIAAGPPRSTPSSTTNPTTPTTPSTPSTPSTPISTDPEEHR